MENNISLKCKKSSGWTWTWGQNNGHSEGFSSCKNCGQNSKLGHFDQRTILNNNLLIWESSYTWYDNNKQVSQKFIPIRSKRT